MFGKFKTVLLFALFTGYLFSIACQKPEEPTPTEPQLLFASGFEDSVYLTLPEDEDILNEYGDYLLIKGIDLTTGFQWPITILGSDFGGLHYVDDDDHKAVEAELQRVVGHNGDTTTALYMRENYSIGVTQFPYEILNVTEGKSDLYVKFWMKVDSVSFSKPDSWRAIFEYKTKLYAFGLGYRLIAYIYTDEDGTIHWHFQGDRNPNHPIWEIDNYDVPVPLNEWFVNEFYWHWSSGDDGITWWKVNGQLIGRHQGPTTRNNLPIDFILLFQIYGDSNPKWQWIDDIEIWTTVPDGADN
jgi:hypothetical protein